MPFDPRRRRCLATLAGLVALGLLPRAIRAGTPPMVLVIGAGAAGLAAASALRADGAKVVVLEARDRIGGRIWTSDALGVPLDLGAAWIHGHRGNPLVPLARTAGVRTRATDWDTLLLYDHDGRPIPDGDLAAAWAAAERVASDLARSARRAEPADSLAGPIARAWQGRLAGLPPSAARAAGWLLHSLIESESGAAFDQRSHAAYDSEDALDGDDLLLDRGYGALLAPMAEGLDIRFGSTVTALRHDAVGVEAETAEGARIRADAAILSVPLGVLKAGTVRIEPPLPARQQMAVERLGMGVLDKLALRFPAPFWPPGDAPFGVIAPEDSPLAGIEAYPVDGLLNAPVLVLLYGGPRARRFAALGSEAGRVTDAMARLRTVFPTAPEPLAAVTTDWAADQWSRGSYSVMAPGSGLDDYRALARPAGPRLWLAGEATVDDFPATVHGAWRSGLRAARSAGRAVARAPRD